MRCVVVSFGTARRATSCLAPAAAQKLALCKPLVALGRWFTKVPAVTHIHMQPMRSNGERNVILWKKQTLSLSLYNNASNSILSGCSEMNSNMFSSLQFVFILKGQVFFF